VIEIDEFVPKKEIDELYLNSPYYIVRAGASRANAGANGASPPEVRATIARRRRQDVRAQRFHEVDDFRCFFFSRSFGSRSRGASIFWPDCARAKKAS
jgi:hypothetical protein